MNIQTLKQNKTVGRWLPGLLLSSAVTMQAYGASKLTVNVHEVKCWDETTGKYREKFGVDTMRLAAITIAPTGVVAKGKLLKLGDFEEDGIIKKYRPPRKLATFVVNNDLKFPIQYQAFLVLAEKDPGDGFNRQIDAFVQQGQAAAVAQAKSLGVMTLEALPSVVATGNVTWETFAAEVGKRLLTANRLYVGQWENGESKEEGDFQRKTGKVPRNLLLEPDITAGTWRMDPTFRENH
jgi:hypothetical protein